MTAASDIRPGDPLFQPLTMRQVMQITQRSERTIERWIASGRLTPYEERNRRGVVVGRIFSEDQVVNAEQERAAAVRENHDRIRRRGGRPAALRALEGARLDEPSGDAS